MVEYRSIGSALEQALPAEGLTVIARRAADGPLTGSRQLDFVL